MFNCASFETDFGSFGSFKKIVFFILDSVFALDEYDREYIRGHTLTTSGPLLLDKGDFGLC